MKKLSKPIIDMYQMSSLFNLYEDDDGMSFYNLLKRININVDNFDDQEVFIPYNITPGDSFTLLAHKFYGNLKLWWVICLLNKIDNPFKRLEIGKRIYLLQPSYMASLLNNLAFSNG